MDSKTLTTLVLLTVAGTVSIFALNYSRYRSAETLLPSRPGKELVIKRCTSCHSVAMFVAVKKERYEWQETLLWMQRMQGMAPLPPEEEQTVLDYLTEALPVKP